MSIQVFGTLNFQIVREEQVVIIRRLRFYYGVLVHFELLFLRLFLTVLIAKVLVDHASIVHLLWGVRFLYGNIKLIVLLPHSIQISNAFPVRIGGWAMKITIVLGLPFVATTLAHSCHFKLCVLQQ